MNYLPILLLAALSGKGTGLSEQTLAPVMNMLGMGDDALAALKQSPFVDLLGKKPSPEQLLPLLLKLMSQQRPASAEIKKGENRPEYLCPIADVAGDEVALALTRYFEKDMH